MAVTTLKKLHKRNTQKEESPWLQNIPKIFSKTFKYKYC